MFRSSPQALLRASSRSVAPGASRAQISRIPRRYASTVPADKPRTWKSSALRWGLAGAIIYYYNTSTLFADQPGLSPQSPPQPVQDDGKFETLESITSKRRERVSASEAIAETSASTGIVGGGSAQMGELSPEELEQEAGQEGAFNPETGEINWDCPCLGGMADGPCGEEFKAAFSCFVFSKEDPKGIDCIENFKGMQDCFRLHPDIYGAELESDDDDEELEAATASATAAKTDSDSSSVTEAKSPVSQSSDEPKVAASPSLAERAKKAADENIPKLKEKAQGVVDHAKDAVEDTRAQIAEKMPELSSRAQGAVKSTQKAVSEQVDRATDAVGARKRALAAKVQVQRDHGE